MNEEQRIENEEEEENCRMRPERKKKCFIIHSDPSYLSAVTKGIRAAHRRSALITEKNINPTGCMFTANTIQQRRMT